MNTEWAYGIQRFTLVKLNKIPYLKYMIIPNKVKSGDAITAKMFNQLIDYVKSITPQDGGHSAGTRLTRGTNGFTVTGFKFQVGYCT